MPKADPALGAAAAETRPRRIPAALTDFSLPIPLGETRGPKPLGTTFAQLPDSSCTKEGGPLPICTFHSLDYDSCTFLDA